MLTFAFRRLLHDARRTLATVVAVAIAVTSFVVLTGTAETQRLTVTETLEENFRGAYDVLVRPTGSANEIERETSQVRASFLSLKQLEYVEAAHALGYARTRIMFRHILPNALQPVIVYGTVLVGSVILSEAALSFLNVGPQDPTPAWGWMVSQGKGDLANASHLLFFPGGAICLTVLALVLVGDGLRDALDPKLT